MLDTRTIPEEIAAINLHAAAGLPGAEGLDISRHLQRLGAWAELVGATTEDALPMFHRSPADFDEPWDSQVRPMALQELRRIVTNYRERNLRSALRSQTFACHF